MLVLPVVFESEQIPAAESGGFVEGSFESDTVERILEDSAWLQVCFVERHDANTTPPKARYRLCSNASLIFWHYTPPYLNARQYSRESSSACNTGMGLDEGDRALQVSPSHRHYGCELVDKGSFRNAHSSMIRDDGI